MIFVPTRVSRKGQTSEAAAVRAELDGEVKTQRDSDRMIRGRATMRFVIRKDGLPINLRCPTPHHLM